ncbi:hypothetical protein SDC9_163254 [bioreactor metagenome]|uniref:Uncharacterized protein n=1 Tax=bioreactor metagenome TaxID=1076179 RepID=A0A645FNB7_9ZZZZ
MSSKQNDIELVVEFANALDNLVAADRIHQKVQQQYIIFAVSNAFDGLIRIVLHINVIAG